MAGTYPRAVLSGVQAGGVQKALRKDQALWYRRTFTVAAAERTLLNFEAVDYRCQVMVNGKQAGGHRGGNTPFTLDITDRVRVGENEVVVRVEDEQEGFQLRGKQTLDPRGIWYTRFPVSGRPCGWNRSVPATSGIC